MSAPEPFRPVVFSPESDPLVTLAAALTELAQQSRQQLDALRQIAEHLRTPATLAALQLPLNPAVLNTMLSAATNLGVATAGIDKFSVSVPAGQTVTGTVPARTGMVTVSTAPIRMTASYYNILITLRVWSDGAELTSPDYPYTLTGSDSVELGQHWYSLRDLQVSITNPTAQATIVTFTSEGLAVERNFFRDFYLPLVQYGYEKLRDLAMTVNGGRALP